MCTQVNTTGAETLYSGIGDLIDADPARTTLVDVCCGTGSIGLTLAKRLAKIRVCAYVYTYPGVFVDPSMHSVLFTDIFSSHSYLLLTD